MNDKDKQRAHEYLHNLHELIEKHFRECKHCKRYRDLKIGKPCAIIIWD